MLNETKFFRRLNLLLSTELGLSPTGLPNFEWGWSEDPKYFHPAPVLYPDGTPIYDSRCSCGINIREGNHRTADPPCNGFIVQELSYRAIRLFDMQGYPDENNQPIKARWLLWRWKAPPPTAAWGIYEAAGLHPGHYRQGAYEPCYANGYVLCIPRDSPQSKIEDLNTLCIGAYRRRMEENARTAANPGERMDGIKQVQENYQRQQRNDLADRLIEETMVMGHLPGEKDGVSFRQVEPKPRISPGGIILPN